MQGRASSPRAAVSQDLRTRRASHDALGSHGFRDRARRRGRKARRAPCNARPVVRSRAPCEPRASCDARRVVRCRGLVRHRRLCEPSAPHGAPFVVRRRPLARSDLSHDTISVARAVFCRTEVRVRTTGVRPRRRTAGFSGIQRDAIQRIASSDLLQKAAQLRLQGRRIWRRSGSPGFASATWAELEHDALENDRRARLEATGRLRLPGEDQDDEGLRLSAPKQFHQALHALVDVLEQPAMARPAAKRAATIRSICTASFVQASRL